MTGGTVSSTPRGYGGRPARASLPSNLGAPSWQSRCVNFILGFLPAKKHLATAEAVREYVNRQVLDPASHAPTGLRRDIVAFLDHVDGWPVYRVARSGALDVGNYVMFLHGGGFFKEIVRAHWKFIDFLVRNAGVQCIVPIYPLTPLATASEIVPGTARLLQELLRRAGAAKVTVVGNSAGATLGLAATQMLRDEGQPLPDALVLISPGGDFTVSRPEQREIALVDPIQDIPGTQEAGRLYAGELDVSHPMVSPLNGDFAGLPRMVIFSGTRDLLYPDSIDMAEKADAAGVPVELHLRAGQPHNYPALPTPEGKEARDAILKAVN